MSQSPRPSGQAAVIMKRDSSCLLFAMQTSEISLLTHKTF